MGGWKPDGNTYQVIEATAGRGLDRAPSAYRPSPPADSKSRFRVAGERHQSISEPDESDDRSQCLLNEKKLTVAGADDLCALNAIVNALEELGKSTLRIRKRRTVGLWLSVGGLTRRPEGKGAATSYLSGQSKWAYNW